MASTLSGKEAEGRQIQSKEKIQDLMSPLASDGCGLPSGWRSRVLFFETRMKRKL